MSKRKGMTFIEVIISIMLLGIISIAILPMATYSVKFTKWNNIRLTALNLAYTQVEWLKSLEYDKLGLDIIGYSPNGVVEPTYYMNKPETVEINGVKYSLHTSIYWEKEKSTTGEPVPQAMKKIDVVVEAKDLNSGGQKEYAVLGTLVSKEGERELSEPGYITVRVNLRGANKPEKNVKIGLGKTKIYSVYTNSDDKGEALFGSLSEGSYFIEPISWKYDKLVAMPNGVEIDGKGIQNWKESKEVVVPKWNNNEQNNIEYPRETFLIDFPGYIDIVDKNATIENLSIEIKPTGESYVPSDGESPDHMTLKTNIKNIGNIKFWRLWNYEYIIKNGDDRYFLIDKENGDLWNGKFNTSNLMETSYEMLYLSFGLEEGSYKFRTENPSKIEEITIGFTSNVDDTKAIIFSLNGNEIPKETYTITRLDPSKTNKFKITFNNDLDFTGDELNFKILNYDGIINNYNMNLAKDRSSIVLILK